MAQSHILPCPLIPVSRMRLASCLLSALCVVPFFCPGHGVAAELLPFQQIPNLPTNTSLTLGNTTYDTPDDLDAMPFLSGGVALDNFGGHDDQGRLASAINFRGLLDPSDLLSLRSMGSAEAGHYHWGTYHLAVGPWASRVGVILSDMSYELGDELESLDAKGKTRTLSAFILQPLLRTGPFQLNGRLQFDDKRLQDEVGVLALNSEKRSRVLNYGLTGTVQDPLLNGATTRVALNWSEGSLNIDGSPWSLVGRADPGHFRILRASLTRLQQLSERLALYFRAQGQWTDDNLDDSEKLYIGGVFGTRSTNQTAVFGDRGWLANLELRYRLTDTWQLVAFADHGEARLNTPSWTVGEATRRLSASGFGAGWASGAWNISTLAGWELGERKAESSAQRQPRLWTQLAYSF